VILTGKFLYSVGGKMCPFPLLEHIVSRVEPTVTLDFL